MAGHIEYKSALQSNEQRHLQIVSTCHVTIGHNLRASIIGQGYNLRAKHLLKIVY